MEIVRLNKNNDYVVVEKLLNSYKDACGCLDEAAGNASAHLPSDEAAVVRRNVARVIGLIDDILISGYRKTHPELFQDEVDIAALLDERSNGNGRPNY
jgi:gamma-glutamyl-gamma-aminobutyrate hydrolase PuuD